VPKSVNIKVASEDLVKNYPDAALISDLTSKGAIKVQSPGSDRLTLPISLHRGEEDALLLAIKLGRSLFVTDDGKAIKAARFFKVPFIMIFNTPSACGGVCSGDIMQHYGIRKKLTQFL